MSEVLIIGELPGVTGRLVERGIAHRHTAWDGPSAALLEGVAYVIADGAAVEGADLDALLVLADRAAVRTAVVFPRMTASILKDVVLRRPGVDAALQADDLTNTDLARLERVLEPLMPKGGAIAIGSLLPMPATHDEYEHERSLSLASESMRLFVTQLRTAIAAMARPVYEPPWVPDDRGPSDLVKGGPPKLAKRTKPLLRDLYAAPLDSETWKLLHPDDRGWGTIPPRLLVMGESGTGKSLVAKLTHEVLTRPDKPSTTEAPFVVISCGGLDTRNFEHLMFGSGPGVFANVDGLPGELARAAYGTAFLDEIGDLPLEAQARMLTFLNDLMITPAGIERFFGFLHVIGATNHELERLRDPHVFRHDLLARFQFRVRLPPLRERSAAELAQLIDFVAQNPNVNPTTDAAGTRLVTHIDPTAHERLVEHRYERGNFRELEEVVFAALGRAADMNSRVVTVEHLDEGVATSSS